jgi:hypothetical protein
MAYHGERCAPRRPGLSIQSPPHQTKLALEKSELLPILEIRQSQKRNRRLAHVAKAL